jgi:hypothetical protein
MKVNNKNNRYETNSTTSIFCEHNTNTKTFRTSSDVEPLNSNNNKHLSDVKKHKAYVLIHHKMKGPVHQIQNKKNNNNNKSNGNSNSNSNSNRYNVQARIWTESANTTSPKLDRKCKKPQARIRTESTASSNCRNSYRRNKLQQQRVNESIYNRLDSHLPKKKEIDNVGNNIPISNSV